MVQNAFVRRMVLPVVVAVLGSSPLAGQQLTPAERDRLDSGALAVLSSTGAPSASIAVVRKGQIVYERAYGNGRGTTAASPTAAW